MRARSNKRARQERIYWGLRVGFLNTNPFCAVCGGAATQIHHKAGRRGDLLLDVSRWLPVCADCHREITERPAWAMENGYSLSRLAS